MGILLDQNDHIRWKVLAATVLERRLSNVVAFCSSQDIRLLTIKGWAAAQNYPPSVIREYGDVDICVSGDDFSRAEALIESPEKVLGKPFRMRSLTSNADFALQLLKRALTRATMLKGTRCDAKEFAPVLIKFIADQNRS